MGQYNSRSSKVGNRATKDGGPGVDNQEIAEMFRREKAKKLEGKGRIYLRDAPGVPARFGVPGGLRGVGGGTSVNFRSCIGRPPSAL